jgi:hypothetical protein
MPVIDRVFWLIAIAVTCANAYILYSRSKAEVARNPELKTGYDSLLKGFLISMNIPWLVMGVGMLIGGVQSVFDYSNPRAGNPYVIAFHSAIFILWALCVFWIYFEGGAEFLVKHPGWINYNIKSVLALKLLLALFLFGGAFAEVAMWFRAPTLPHR